MDRPVDGLTERFPRHGSTVLADGRQHTLSPGMRTALPHSAHEKIVRQHHQIQVPSRSLWRAPEDHRRPDRSDLDPDLSGGGRAAGGAPAEGPAAAAVRVRGLTSPPFAPGAVSRREECVLNGLIEYRIGPATGPQTTKPYCEPCQTTCNRSSASLPCPLGVFGALTRGPKRRLILPILQTSDLLSRSG